MTPSVACPDRRGWSSSLMPSSMMLVWGCCPAERRSCGTRDLLQRPHETESVLERENEKKKKVFKVKEKPRPACRASLWHRGCSAERERERGGKKDQLQRMQKVWMPAKVTAHTKSRRALVVSENPEQIRKVCEQSPVRSRTRRERRVHKPSGGFLCTGSGSLGGRGGEGEKKKSKRVWQLILLKNARENMCK